MEIANAHGLISVAADGQPPPEVHFTGPRGVYERAVHGVWGLYGRAVHAFAGRRTVAGRRETFRRVGAISGVLPPDVVDEFVTSLEIAERMQMRQDDRTPGYRWSPGLWKIEARMNAGHRYYRLGGHQQAALRRIVQTLADPVAEAMGCPWRVVHARCLETLPAAEAMGPNTWHGDGFPHDIVKIMTYLSPAGIETGTTELLLPDGSRRVVLGPPGTWLFFKNSELLHRGMPPQTVSRLAVELTVVPSFTQGAAPLVPGLNAIYPEFPWSTQPVLRAVLAPIQWALVLLDALSPDRLSRSMARSRKSLRQIAQTGRKRLSKHVKRFSKTARGWAKGGRTARKRAAGQVVAVARLGAGLLKIRGKALHRFRRVVPLRGLTALNACFAPRGLNIGGGPEFFAFRWRNLDGAAGAANPVPFQFSPGCVFPLADGGMHVVYTSHCLEHLDDPTVERVLRQAWRVLRPGGRFVIKVPDFDRAQRCWREDDMSFFDDRLWGFRRIRQAWRDHGIDDGIDYRAAFVFCGFWTGTGRHFGTYGGDVGYHGPPRVPRELLKEWVATRTPHQLAAALSTYVREHEASYQFNHQNAWSGQELRRLVAAHGFRVESLDADLVIAQCRDIPGIMQMQAISQYCLARKPA